LINLSPNPVADKTVLTISSAKADKIDIKVIDFTGKVVNKQMMNLIAGNNTIDIDIATMPSGVYVIAVKNAEGEIKLMRLMKY
jgi:hypothetical protein